MTDQQHPTPPPELFRQWEGMPRSLAFEAAYRAGADQELKACCEALARELICDGKHVATDLRAARRPKPPSLKEQALALLSKTESPVMLGTPEYRLSESDAAVVRRALEQLND